MGEGEGGARTLTPAGRYRIEIRPAAKRALAKLPRDAAALIARAIDALEAEPRSLGVKRMRGSEDLYRIRVGSFRVVYEIHDDVLLVLVVRIGHRRDVYR